VLIGAGLLLLARVVRQRRISRGLAVALAIAFAFWILAGINRDETRLPTSSRFQYPSAVFLLLVVGEGLRGLRRPPLALAAAALGTALAISGGISLLEREHRDHWVPYADSLRANLGAIEIAGPASDPGFTVFFPPDIRAPAGHYLDAAERFGSPAFSEAEIEAHPEANLGAADVSLAQALGLTLEPPPPGSRPLRCQGLEATPEGLTGLTLFPGSFSFENRGQVPVEILLSRYASEFSVVMGSLEPGLLTSLEIPEDGSQRPWLLGLRGTGPVELCVRGGGS